MPAAPRSASVCEHFTPPVSPSSSPALRASITSGWAPAPITTRSASIVLPDSVTTRSTRFSPSKRATPSPVTNSIPCEPSRSWKNRPASVPKPVDSGASSSITSVHCLPSVVSEAATSQAM